MNFQTIYDGALALTIGVVAYFLKREMNSLDRLKKDVLTREDKKTIDERVKKTEESIEKIYNKLDKMLTKDDLERIERLMERIDDKFERLRENLENK